MQLFFGFFSIISLFTLQHNTHCSSSYFFLFLPRNLTHAPCEVPFCKFCSEPSKCGECLADYSLSELGTCVLPTSDCEDLKGCLTCEGLQCTLCKDAYKINKGACHHIKKFTTIELLLIILCSVIMILLLNVVVVVRCRSKQNKTKKEEEIIQDNNDKQNKDIKCEVSSKVRDRSYKSKSNPRVLRSMINQPMSNSTSFNLNASLGINSSNSNILSQINEISFINSHLDNNSSLCFVCHKEKIFMAMSCTCGLCYVHYIDFLKEPNKFQYCPRHKVKIASNYLVKVEDRKELISPEKITIKKPLSKKFEEDVNKCEFCEKVIQLRSGYCSKGCLHHLCEQCYEEKNDCPKCKLSLKE